MAEEKTTRPKSRRRVAKSEAKLIVKVVSIYGAPGIQTRAIFDARTGKAWTAEQISARGVANFGNVADMKETLNWNLNGDDKKYCFEWTVISYACAIGQAYIFD